MPNTLKGFINRWQPKYDEKEHDEGEYREIIKCLNDKKSISKELFERILRWKSDRIMGKIDWDNFEQYESILDKLPLVSDREKLNLLVALPGIGIPFASTILHFILPGRFPIIDIRTVEALSHFNYIDWRAINTERYWEFCKVMNEIKIHLKEFNLREIDRALFAFHKLVLSK